MCMSECYLRYLFWTRVLYQLELGFKSYARKCSLAKYSKVWAFEDADHNSPLKLFFYPPMIFFFKWTSRLHLLYDSNITKTKWRRLTLLPIEDFTVTKWCFWEIKGWSVHSAQPDVKSSENMRLHGTLLRIMLKQYTFFSLDAKRRNNQFDFSALHWNIFAPWYLQTTSTPLLW